MVTTWNKAQCKEIIFRCFYFPLFSNIVHFLIIFFFFSIFQCRKLFLLLNNNNKNFGTSREFVKSFVHYLWLMNLEEVIEFTFQVQGMPQEDKDIRRENWDAWDPMLISEGLFSAANIFRWAKLRLLTNKQAYVYPPLP